MSFVSVINSHTSQDVPIMNLVRELFVLFMRHYIQFASNPVPECRPSLFPQASRADKCFLVRRILLGAHTELSLCGTLLPITLHFLHALCDSACHLTQILFFACLVRAIYLFIYHVFLHIGEVATKQQAYVFMLLLCFVYATKEVRHQGWAVGTCPALQLLAGSWGTWPAAPLFLLRHLACLLPMVRI